MPLPKFCVQCLQSFAMNPVRILLSLFLVLAINYCRSQAPVGAARAAKSTEIHFEVAKHDLTLASDSALLQISAFTKGKDNYTVKITAHTDGDGSTAYNMALSERRAQAVKDFLVKKGMEAERISFDFFGEKQPTANNDTETGKFQNRRATVEVFLTLPVVTIEGIVKDEKTGEPLVADVIIGSKDAVDSLRTDADGRFKTTVVAGVVLRIDVAAKCHFSQTQMVKAAPKTPTVAFNLRPAVSGAVLQLENLYFVGNQPMLLESSKSELPKILKFMQQNPGMKIEIAGHVNRPGVPPVPKDSWDFRLSEDRAKTVYDYLIENGISNEKVSWKGYGNSQMIFPSVTSTQEQQAQNRRVEMRVLESGCD